MSGKNWKAYLALGIICIVWGTTYLALGIGVKTIPPFIFSGLRQVTAGGVLLMVMYFMGKARNITRKDWMIQAVPGLLMIAMGNGLIGWAEMYIPTGLAALIVAILPVYVVILNYLLSREKKIPNRDVIIGLILGCLGIFLIFRDNLKDLFNPKYLSGMLLCFLSCLAWAFGTLFIKKRKPSHHPLVNASMQMFTGGLWLLLMSVFWDDFGNISGISSDSIWALVYLTVFGSLVAYSCFVIALEKLPAAVVSVYAYINPFIALLLGYFLLDEPLTIITMLALIVTLAGTYWINKGFAKETKEQLQKEIK